jgi:hypothetical protein
MMAQKAIFAIDCMSSKLKIKNFLCKLDLSQHSTSEIIKKDGDTH